MCKPVWLMCKSPSPLVILWQQALALTLQSFFLFLNVKHQQHFIIPYRSSAIANIWNICFLNKFARLVIQQYKGYEHLISKLLGC